MNSFSHLDDAGNARMVDVAAKLVTYRTARARSIVQLPGEVLELLQGDDILTKKGSVFQTARIAGIMAAKRTSELIPMCHPIGLEKCDLDISLNEQRELVIDCTCAVTAKTGIEMEALTGASVAALTIYDMCKGISHNIIIKETTLLEKTGGKSDYSKQ